MASDTIHITFDIFHVRNICQGFLSPSFFWGGGGVRLDRQLL